MIEKILDLHIHSRYSRACSPKLELPQIAEFCARKGADIVSTADFTHPQWFKHIEENLTEVGKTGLYKIKNSDVLFILSTEISCIYKHKDKVRRLHLMIFAPNLETVKKFNNELEKRGVNIRSDGRPIMGLSAKDVLQLCLDIEPRMIMVPAHAWTPWFSVFGSKSGYDSLEECFEELTPHITAIETGLSSDPPMNRRLTNLDRITLISNSDAHSLDHIGREANAFAFESQADINYDEITRIIREGDRKKFLYTIEFYPEEGMYHFDGHRGCGVSFSPEQTRKEKDICPKCKKKLTVGVLNRVESLADRVASEAPVDKFIPHKYIVPLREIIGAVFEVGAGSKKVTREYNAMIKALGSEFNILLHSSSAEIDKAVSDKGITLAINNMREGKVKITPGYDGVYGKVEVLSGDKSWHAKQSRLF